MNNTKRYAAFQKHIPKELNAYLSFIDTTRFVLEKEKYDVETTDILSIQSCLKDLIVHFEIKKKEINFFLYDVIIWKQLVAKFKNYMNHCKKSKEDFLVINASNDSSIIELIEHDEIIMNNFKKLQKEIMNALKQKFIEHLEKKLI